MVKHPIILDDVPEPTSDAFAEKIESMWGEPEKFPGTSFAEQGGVILPGGKGDFLSQGFSVCMLALMENAHGDVLAMHVLPFESEHEEVPSLFSKEQHELLKSFGKMAHGFWLYNTSTDPSFALKRLDQMGYDVQPVELRWVGKDVWDIWGSDGKIEIYTSNPGTERQESVWYPDLMERLKLEAQERTSGVRVR